MIDLASTYIQAKNALKNTDPFYFLAEVDLPTPLRICVNASDDVIWNGNTWTAIPMDIAPIKQNKGETPQLTVQVWYTQEAHAQLEAASGGIGLDVTFYIVYVGDLTETTNIPTFAFNIVGCKVTTTWITFTLGASSIFNKPFPQDLMLKNFCRFKFPHSEDARCPYTGGTSECDRTLATCISLNGTNAHRFGGFPTIGTNEIYAS